MKVAFLDRDGTINRDYPDAEWAVVAEPELLEGALVGMKSILKKGYEIIIVTNQYTIGEGFITQGQYEDFNDKLLDTLAKNGVSVLDVFYCPHARRDNCDCCKPRTGMIAQAISKYPDIDMSQSFMCGDSAADMKCAYEAGLRFIGIGIGEQQIRDLSEIHMIV